MVRVTNQTLALLIHTKHQPYHNTLNYWFLGKHLVLLSFESRYYSRSRLGKHRDSPKRPVIKCILQNSLTSTDDKTKKP